MSTTGLLVHNHNIKRFDVYCVHLQICKFSHWHIRKSSLTYWEKLLDEYLIILYRSHFLEHTNFWWSGSNVVG